MAQSPGPIELSSPPSSSHHSHHSSYDPYSLDNNGFLDSPGRDGSGGGGPGDVDDFMGGMGGMEAIGMDTLEMMGIEMGMSSPSGIFGDAHGIELGGGTTNTAGGQAGPSSGSGSSPSPQLPLLNHQQHQVDPAIMPMTSTSMSTTMNDNQMDGRSPADNLNQSSGPNSAQSGGTPSSSSANVNVNNIDISSMPTHAQMQSLFGASGFKMDKQAYAAALCQHQANQQQSRGSSGEQDENADRSGQGVKRGISDEGGADDENDVEFVSSSRIVSRGVVDTGDNTENDNEQTPRTARTRSVSNKRRKRDQDAASSSSGQPPVPPLPLQYTNANVKVEDALPSPLNATTMDVPSTPRMKNGSRHVIGAPSTPGRNMNPVNNLNHVNHVNTSSPEVGSKAAVQRSLGISGGSGPSGPKTPRKATSMSGRKRGRDDEDRSASNPSASDDETPSSGQGVHSGHGSMPHEPDSLRKQGMIFKNAFGASDVEDDDDDEGDDEPGGSGGRSASKGKKKMPSNGVGINPTDGQPGGFELVDKDGDSMRRKIRIEYITDKSRRHITFSKRKAGIMKKAYELSTLTGTQVLLLVVSETGLVYTFTTAKLQPLVTQSEGKNLIQACLNAPGADDEEHGGQSAATSSAPSRKERPLAIRPLKLNAEETGKLAASAASAIPVPPIPEDTTPRPRKRLPSGKNRRPSKKEQQALKDAQTDGQGNPLSEGNNPTSESDTQTIEVPEHNMHMGHHISSAGSGLDMQAAQQQQQQQQHSHQQHMPPQPLQHQPQQQPQHNGQHMHMQTTPVSATFSTASLHPSLTGSPYHMSPSRAQINHQGGYYHSPQPHHGQPMMNMQPNFSYPTPPTHAPPQYLSGVHHGMGGSQGFDPNHFTDSNAFVAHQNGMAM